MKYIKEFERFEINEGLFSNSKIQEGIELANNYFKQNPQVLEDLKNKTAGEFAKFSKEEIEDFKNKLDKFNGPIDPQVIDAAEKVTTELNESNFLLRALKYLAIKLFEFLGIAFKWMDVFLIVGSFIVGTYSLIFDYRSGYLWLGLLLSTFTSLMVVVWKAIDRYY